MAGAQLAHNRIVANLIRFLGNCVVPKGCVALPSDMLLKIPECEKFVYPDLTIGCGDIQIDEHKHLRLDVLLNPSMVIEVLSGSTSDYDQTEKRRCYFTLLDLKQYVVVDSEKIGVQPYTRTPENDWLLHLVNQIDDKVKIEDCEIAM